MAFSYAQLEGLWIKAGGDPNVAYIAAAIVYPESGGNPSALNPTDNNGTQSSFGLWQISNGTHTPPDPNWADPLTNARLAVGKYNGAGHSFSPWGTYDTGAYKRYIQTGVAPDMSAGGAGLGNAVPGGVPNVQLASANPLDPSTWTAAIGNTLASFGNYVYIGLVIAGGAGLIIVGLMLMMRETTIQGVVGGAANVTVRGLTTRRETERDRERDRARRNEINRRQYRERKKS